MEMISVRVCYRIPMDKGLYYKRKVEQLKLAIPNITEEMVRIELDRFLSHNEPVNETIMVSIMADEVKEE